MGDGADRKLYRPDTRHEGEASRALDKGVGCPLLLSGVTSTGIHGKIHTDSGTRVFQFLGSLCVCIGKWVWTWWVNRGSAYSRSQIAGRVALSMSHFV